VLSGDIKEVRPLVRLGLFPIQRHDRAESSEFVDRSMVRFTMLRKDLSTTWELDRINEQKLA
jgi:hypothetical protein